MAIFDIPATTSKVPHLFWSVYQPFLVMPKIVSNIFWRMSFVCVRVVRRINPNSV